LRASPVGGVDGLKDVVLSSLGESIAVQVTGRKMSRFGHIVAFRVLPVHRLFRTLDASRRVVRAVYWRNRPSNRLR